MDPFNTLVARLVIMEEKGSYIYSWQQWTKEKHNWLCSEEKPLWSKIVSSFGIGGKWCETKSAFFLTWPDVENASSADITGHSWKEQPAPPRNALFSSREWNQVDVSEREWHQNSVILDSLGFYQLGRRPLNRLWRGTDRTMVVLCCSTMVHHYSKMTSALRHYI